jgi:1-aminocyclopropane-1-carboxylate deaminase/D-cysteine desulfhydrase-like pyridoxal-dependent ACC family enzyme
MISTIDQLVKLTDACLQPLRLSPLLSYYSVDVLRLDKIHAIISGNKWFKLRYSLKEAIDENKKTIITAGGAYSNHILATACASSLLGLKSIGIIRGERPTRISCTLEQASKWGMQFEFISRSAFRNMKQLSSVFRDQNEHSYFIEEGGRNENGIRGAAEIPGLVKTNEYDFVCCALGTGTMMAGLLRSVQTWQRVIGISSLKLDPQLHHFPLFFDEVANGNRNYDLYYEYHFGGYGKYTKELIAFMNETYLRNGMPTDFVYTAKLFFGVYDLLQKGYFKTNSRILIIHSGGLQGNCSIPTGTLLF